MNSVLCTPYVGELVILCDSNRNKSYAAVVTRVTDRFFYVGHDGCFIAFRIKNWEQATVYQPSYTVKSAGSLSVEIPQ